VTLVKNLPCFHFLQFSFLSHAIRTPFQCDKTISKKWPLLSKNRLNLCHTYIVKKAQRIS
jgi:hypothetical protein